ncbi:MAG: hypothetical protein AABP62_26910 [Planctomycetota bacterium]
MTPRPKLTSEANVVIEQVVRKPDIPGDFVVTFRLADGERRSVCVSYKVLLDFAEFRAAALFSANVFLRHEAEQGTPESLCVWLGVISEAIIRGNERPAATKGGD